MKRTWIVLLTVVMLTALSSNVLAEEVYSENCDAVISEEEEFALGETGCLSDADPTDGMDEVEFELAAPELFDEVCE